ncbi:hypothetical protein HYALB_00008418 [Hymenoscyphus albidus]|uniref:Cupin type-1 domain-containing protein n=1 Tax=Hymenoscyphus albidus TaxID=595503 RepID=A0A9N9LJV6_9HELO|nr:hypothetical protein HYALB_00008418 [Hymenoscyphus albidus]
MRTSLLQATALFVVLTSAAATPPYPIPEAANDAPQPQRRQTKHLRPIIERVPASSLEKRAEEPLQPVVGVKGAPLLIPENSLLDSQNPDHLQTNPTDGGLVTNLKWSMSLSGMNLFEGGFVREQVVTDLPPSKDFSAAQNHVNQGAIRHMHWHDINEWGYVTAGSLLIGAVSDEGKNQVFRANKGDMWFFPKGQGHVIQGLSSPGAEYLLVFDNGDFDAKGRTFNVDDWLVHTPPSVLAKNFGMPESVFASIPKSAASIMKGNASTGLISSPNGKLEGASSFHYRASEKPFTVVEGGRYLKVDKSVFPIQTTLASQIVEIKPGAMREMHWHPTGVEWVYFVQGSARATVWLGGANARTFDFTTGDTAVFPDNSGHYIENVSNETVTYLEIFKADTVKDFSLSQWLSLTPNDLVAQVLNVSIETVKKFRTDKPVIVMGKK